MGPFQLAVGIAVLASLGCGLIIFGVYRSRTAETVEQRMERLAVSDHPMEEEELDLPFLDRVVKPWLRAQVRATGRLTPSRDIQKLRLNLARAGYPHDLTVLDMLGFRLLLSTGLVSFALFALRSAPFAQLLAGTVVLAAMGFLAPGFWLSSRVKQRKRELFRSLPDALDMLTICVDAGAGLESAMLRLSQKWQNAAATEFGKVVAEIRLGMTRRTALQNLAARTEVPEVRSFVAVLLQADQFGLSIAKVLHMQSDQMRTRRWQRAEERARKVAIKMLFPLVFLIMPAMFAVTVGPAIPVLIQTFAGMRGR